MPECPATPDGSDICVREESADRVLFVRRVALMRHARHVALMPTESLAGTLAARGTKEARLFWPTRQSVSRGVHSLCCVSILPVPQMSTWRFYLLRMCTAAAVAAPTATLPSRVSANLSGVATATPEIAILSAYNNDTEQIQASPSPDISPPPWPTPSMSPPPAPMPPSVRSPSPAQQTSSGHAGRYAQNAEGPAALLSALGLRGIVRVRD